MSSPGNSAATVAILRKDLLAELRTLRSLAAMVLFSVTTFVIFRFGLDRTQLSGDLAAGVLVTTILFAAILGINRLFVSEYEEGGFDLLRLAPVEGVAMFVAKTAAMVIYLTALELVAVPIFAVFFLQTAGSIGLLVVALLLTNLGIAAIGVVISSMAVHSRARDLLIPLLLLPLVVPLLIASAGALANILEAGGVQYDGLWRWLAGLAVYDLIFGLVGYAVFDYLLED